MTAWLYLGAAIVLEIIGTSLLKLSDGFEKTHWGALAIIAYSLSFWVFAPALKVIPVGVAYAIWSGAGILAITIIGVFFFEQRLQVIQYLFIALIVAGAIGLNLTSRA